MKVRVDYTVDVDDDYRMALRHHFGKHGTLATRDEVKNHLRANGESLDDDLWDEWQDCDEGCQP